MSGYQYWKDALAGKNPKMFVDQPECGFYRKPIKERNSKGDNKRIGWAPVAIFVDGDDMTQTMIGRVGARDIMGDDLNELWSYVAGNPISEETYRAVAERGEPFPDEQPKVPAANREVTASDNAEPQDDTPLAEQHATAIDNAIAAAIKKVTTEAEAAQALGSKNRIAELRLAADKAGKAIYDPIYRQYTAEQKKWSPIVNRAQDAEATLNKAILKFRESERVRIAKEQAEADEKQRLQDDANARAADRAIARGEPEQPPEVEEVVAPAAPAPITPTYGTRGIREQVHTILDSITDFDQVYAFLKSEPKVKALLLELATAKVKAGFTVPGTTTREGLI